MSVQKSDGLLAQWTLLGAVINSRWATALDHKITWHVLDRYYAKHENARASSRYLVKVTGGERRNVINSLRRLVEHGVLFVVRQGIGSRPTEYGVNFASGVAGDTTTGTDQDHSSGVAGDTGVVSHTTPLQPPSGVAGDTESYLLDRPTGRATEVGTTHAAASPGATRPATATRDPAGFDELWDAYGYRKDREQAKAAYAKLAPTAELHATLVKVARAWFAKYEADGTHPDFRKRLHTWLRGECWLEDLPTPYVKRAPRASKPSQSDSGAPVGRHFVKIVKASMTRHDAGNSDMSFRYKIVGGRHDGQEFTHDFPYMRPDGVDVDSSFSAIRNASGVSDPNDMTEFEGATLHATVTKHGEVNYLTPA